MPLPDTRTHCKNGHPFNDHNNYKNKQGYFRCRVCNKLRMREVNSTPEAKAKNTIRAMAWINAHREHYREYCRNRRKQNNLYITEIKSKGCSRCSETFKDCLDFHHRNRSDKRFDIGNRASAVSLETLKKEVAKCDLLCCNCHRKQTAAKRAEEKRKSG